MAVQKRHYYPDALVVFVKGFRHTDAVSEEAKPALQIYRLDDIQSINISSTVKGGPSTFSLSLRDKGNRLIQQANIEKEIKNVKEGTGDEDVIEYTVQVPVSSTEETVGKSSVFATVQGKHPNIPDNYWRIVKKYAGELDPGIISHQMNRESSFNPFALSSKNAAGLMQLLVGTANDMLGGEKKTSVQELQADVDLNIKLGIEYLRKQYHKFGKDYSLALAAYNAGPGNVIKYGKIPPFPETINYVNAILGTDYQHQITTVYKDQKIKEGTKVLYDDLESFLNTVDYILVDEAGNRRKVFSNVSYTGEITRWAFDVDGQVIPVSGHLSDTLIGKYTEERLKALNKTSLVEFLLEDRVTSKKFYIEEYRNRDLINVFKSDLSLPFEHVNPIVEPMDRVCIFLSQRFDSTNKTSYQIPGIPLVRAFVGLVNTVQIGYSESGNTLDITGEDVTKLLRLSLANTNPGIFADKMQDILKSEGDRLKLQSDFFGLFTNIFHGLTSPNIIKVLTVGREKSEVEIKSKGDPVDGTNFAGVENFELATDNVLSDRNSVTYNPVNGTFRLTTGHEVPDEHLLLGNALFDSTKIRVQDLTNTDVHSYKGYPFLFAAPNEWQSDYEDRRSMCARVAEESNYLFYADRNGDIWFHPYRFDQGWIFSAQVPDVYVLDDSSIISYGFVEDDSQVYTAFYVNTQGDYQEGQAPPGVEGIGKLMGTFRDGDAALKYGERIFKFSNPLIKSNDQVNLYLYAKSIAQRMLAGRYQGQVTLTGRAELEPGYPVYIPCRNMMYFVESVDHSFSFGGQFTTTVHLAYGRKLWETLPETISYGGKFTIGKGKVDPSSVIGKGNRNISDIVSVYIDYKSYSGSPAADNFDNYDFVVMEDGVYGKVIQSGTWTTSPLESTVRKYQEVAAGDVQGIRGGDLKLAVKIGSSRRSEAMSILLYVKDGPTSKVATTVSSGYPVLGRAFYALSSIGDSGESFLDVSLKVNPVGIYTPSTKLLNLVARILVNLQDTSSDDKRSFRGGLQIQLSPRIMAGYFDRLVGIPIDDKHFNYFYELHRTATTVAGKIRSYSQIFFDYFKMS